MKIYFPSQRKDDFLVELRFIKRLNYILVLCLFVAVCFTFITGYVNSDIPTTENRIDDNIGIAHILLDHGSISITSDTGFNFTNGVTEGNGSFDNPFVIRDWLINVTNTTGISIINTKAYFFIRNCIVKGNNSCQYLGININNAYNGRIDGCEISGSNYRGIYVYKSENCAITNNSVHDNVIGLWIHTRSNKNRILDNHIYNNNANKTSGGVGLVIGEVNGCIISHNHICDGTQYGIILHYAEYNIIEYNIVENNLLGCVQLDSASKHNIIHENRFINNNGGTKQAIDNGKENTWYYNKRGNYWSDWTSPDNNSDGIVDFPYIVNASLGITDPYPLVDLIIPQPADMQVIILSAVIMTAIAFRNRRYYKTVGQNAPDFNHGDECPSYSPTP